MCTLCTHYARACTARMCALTHYWTGFSPKLMETYLGSQKRVRHNLFLRACLRVHAMRVDAHARMCTFAHFWRYSLNNLWKHHSACATCFLRAHLRVHTMHALCACVHCTYVRAHTLLDGFSPKLMETYLGSQKRAQHNGCVCAHLRVHAMCVGARTLSYIMLICIVFHNQQCLFCTQGET
jgi:hypothetical protein